jgi:hypothetical protein
LANWSRNTGCSSGTTLEKIDQIFKIGVVERMLVSESRHRALLDPPEDREFAGRTSRTVIARTRHCAGVAARATTTTTGS